MNGSRIGGRARRNNIGGEAGPVRRLCPKCTRAESTESLCNNCFRVMYLA